MRAYAALIGSVLIIFVFEKYGAYVTASHALDVDAWHVLGHLVPFAAGFAALSVAHRGGSPQTMERCASLFNVLFLGAIAYWAAWKGVTRLVEPVHIPAFSMLVFAIIGMGGNVFQLYYVHYTRHAHTEAHTYWGQLWHIVGDLLGSVAVVVAGILMLWQEWVVVDAIAALVVAFIVGLLALTQALNLYRAIKS